MLKSGKLRADKVKYADGIGCCVWYPCEDDENTGLCFDFDFDDLDDFMALLEQIKTAEAKELDDE